MKKAILFLSIVSVFISSGAAYADELSLKPTKPKTSVIELNTIADASEQGVTITAEIPMKLRVIKIVLYYRAIGDSGYIRKTMHADQNGEYRYVINQAEIGAPGFEYYIEAADLIGDTLLHGHANFPLVAKFMGSVGSGTNKFVVGKGRNQSVDAKEAAKLTSDTLLHGHTNLPLDANFVGSGMNKFVLGKGHNQSDDAKDPLWKNKWLWIGVGVLAAAAISNNNGDGNDSADKPGFSITIEGPQPDPSAP